MNARLVFYSALFFKLYWLVSFSGRRIVEILGGRNPLMTSILNLLAQIIFPTLFGLVLYGYGKQGKIIHEMRFLPKNDPILLLLAFSTALIDVNIQYFVPGVVRLFLNLFSILCLTVAIFLSLVEYVKTKRERYEPLSGR